MEDQINYNRLYWSCRRGMLELDLLLIPFLQHHHALFTEEEESQFKSLLEHTDVDLYAWLNAHVNPPTPEISALIARIREYAKSTNHLNKIKLSD